MLLYISHKRSTLFISLTSGSSAVPHPPTHPNVPPQSGLLCFNPAQGAPAQRAIVLRHRNRPGIDTQVPVYLQRAEGLEVQALMSNSQTDRSGAKPKPLGVISKSISLPDVMDQQERAREKVKKRSTGRVNCRRFFKMIFHFLFLGLLSSFSCDIYCAS